MMIRNTRVFFLLAVFALLAVSAFATPIYNYQYQYVPIGTPSGTSSGSCSPSGASTVCVDAGTSASQYLELWNNSGSDADEGWSWANSTVDNTSFSSQWWNVSTSSDSGGGAVFYVP